MVLQKFTKVHEVLQDNCMSLWPRLVDTKSPPRRSEASIGAGRHGGKVEIRWMEQGACNRRDGLDKGGSALIRSLVGPLFPDRMATGHIRIHALFWV